MKCKITYSIDFNLEEAIKSGGVDVTENNMNTIIKNLEGSKKSVKNDIDRIIGTEEIKEESTLEMIFIENEKEIQMKNQTESQTVDIRMAKTNTNAILPTKTDENAGYDIYSCFEEDCMVIPPFTSVFVPTGIATVIPITHYAQVFERGSTGSKSMKYGAGVIDSGFRGEWKICIYNGNSKPIVIAKKSVNTEDIIKDAIIYPYEKAIAQFVILPVPQTNITEISIEELLNYESERGVGMDGSSGK